MPGYIKPVGGHNRMRLVQPGYDVDTAPPNKVIIDTDDIGTLSLLDSGIYRFNNTNKTVVSRQIATWDLDYIPLCTFQFRYSLWPNHWRPFFFPSSIDTRLHALTVTETGITVRVRIDTTYVDFAWQAYRLAVAP